MSVRTGNPFRHWGRRRHKRYGFVVDPDDRLRIGRKGQGERLTRMCPELARLRKTCTKLLVEGGPRYPGRSRQMVETVCKPDVEIDRHAAPRKGTDRRLAYGQWMPDQRFVEHLVEDNRFPPQRKLRSCIGAR